MVKNTSGGNKAKKQKRVNCKKVVLNELGDGQMFGKVIEARGGNHYTILCTDNVSRIGRLGSSARKRGSKIISGIFVVVSLRDFETEQKNCDILGTANPPVDIRNIFKKINPSKNDDIVEFYDSDNNFDEFEESQATTVKLSHSEFLSKDVTKTIDEEIDEINFDDL